LLSKDPINDDDDETGVDEIEEDNVDIVVVENNDLLLIINEKGVDDPPEINGDEEA